MTQALATSKLLCCCAPCCPATLVAQTDGYVDGIFIGSEIAFTTPDCAGNEIIEGTDTISGRFPFGQHLGIYAAPTMYSDFVEDDRIFSTFSYWHVTIFGDEQNETLEYHTEERDHVIAIVPEWATSILCVAHYLSPEYDYQVFTVEANFPYHGAYDFDAPCWDAGRPARPAIRLSPTGGIRNTGPNPLPVVLGLRGVTLWYARHSHGGPETIRYTIAEALPSYPVSCYTPGQGTGPTGNYSCVGTCSPAYHWLVGNNVTGQPRYRPYDPTVAQVHADDGHTYYSCVWDRFRNIEAPSSSVLQVWRFDESPSSDEYCSIAGNGFVNKYWECVNDAGYPEVFCPDPYMQAPRVSDEVADETEVSVGAACIRKTDHNQDERRRLISEHAERRGDEARARIDGLWAMYADHLRRGRIRLLADEGNADVFRDPTMLDIAPGLTVRDGNTIFRDAYTMRRRACVECGHYLRSEVNCGLLKRPGAECNAHYRRLLTKGLGHPSADCPWNKKG